MTQKDEVQFKQSEQMSRITV